METLNDRKKCLGKRAEDAVLILSSMALMLLPDAAFAAPSLSGVSDWFFKQLTIAALIIVVALVVVAIVRKEFAKMAGIIVVGGIVVLFTMKPAILKTIGTFLGKLLGL